MDVNPEGTYPANGNWGLATRPLSSDHEQDGERARQLTSPSDWRERGLKRELTQKMERKAILC